MSTPIGLDLVRGEERIFVSLLWWWRATTLASMHGWSPHGARKPDGRIGDYLLCGNTVLEEDARSLSGAIRTALPRIGGSGDGYLDRLDMARQNASGEPNVEMLMPEPPEDPIEFFQGKAGRGIIEAIASFTARGEFSIEPSRRTIG